MVDPLDLLLGRVGFPEGFHTAIGKRLKPDLHAPSIVFNAPLDRDYYFLFTEIRAQWAQPAFTAPVLSLEIIRQEGDRHMQQGNLGVNAIALGNLATPGESAQPTGSTTPPPRIRLKAAVGINLLYFPGSILQMVVSGFGDGFSTQEPPYVDLVAIGHYVLKPGAY